MPKHIAMLTIKALNDAKKVIHGSSVLIMGLTFKENVEDTRETPVKELIKELKEFKCKLYGYDPLLNKDEIESFGIEPLDNLDKIKVDCVIITVVHDVFKKMGLDELKRIMGDKPILIDVRGYFSDKVASVQDFFYRKL
jgi:UDPglucose 6-dehydrogenase/UDP-N-acetyl-D-galactosamine dehydrogenase